MVKIFDNDSLAVRKSTLSGKIRLSGAKNSALKLLTASLLTDESVILTNSPNNLIDMRIHIAMLELLGKKCIVEEDNLHISYNGEISSELVWKGQSIRNTLLIFGALLVRKGEARVPLPGGCNLGDRKIDLHVMILKKMGADIYEEEGYLVGNAPGGLKGSEVYLKVRSTGATENAIISGCLARGTTTIWGPHIRPEISDLIKFLRSMGADIEERGQERIIIRGVKKLSGTRHCVIQDSMEAMTFLIGAAITGGCVEIEDFPHQDLEVPLIFLRESGLKIRQLGSSAVVEKGRCFPVEIATGPYPGINSDLQPLFAVYGLRAIGESRIFDLRFPMRYGYISELIKLGGECIVKDGILRITGGNVLKGTKVYAQDLRCGASLILSGLIAEQETIISNAWQIDRGYENVVDKFKKQKPKTILSHKETF